MFKIDNILLPPALYIVSTPIGNLKDITIRALTILKNSNYIACEDTRITKKLLSAYEIKSKNLISMHDHSSKKKIITLIKKIEEGNSVSLVSDAGTPIISDPGYEIVDLAIKNNITISPIPGASAITSSIPVSGLASDKFFFIGFLPNKTNKRKILLKKLKENDSLLIFYESANRIKQTISEIYSIFGNRKCFIARELTKYYETFYRGDLIKFKNINEELKGEITVLIAPKEKKVNLELFTHEIEKIISLTKEKLSTKDLAELLSIIYKKPKKFFYSKLIKSI